MDLTNDTTDFVFYDATNSISKAPITREELSEELQEQLELLKKMHDYDYAKQCVLEKLEKEYQEMVDTEIWYEAAKTYLNSKISTSKFDTLLWDFKYKHSLFDWSGNVLTINDSTGWQNGISYTQFSPPGSSSDINFMVHDGDEQKWLSIRELHNPYPNVELDDDFKMFCIKYKRDVEEE